MKKNFIYNTCLLFFLPLGLGLLLTSCTKEGIGGKATIKGMVMHHDNPIPGATVYIKYDATESPGTDVTYYNDHVTTDASANFQFVDLKKGDYYLFAVGFDSSITLPVSGGVPAKIKKKTETVEIHVPVTE